MHSILSSLSDTYGQGYLHYLPIQLLHCSKRNQNTRSKTINMVRSDVILMLYALISTYYEEELTKAMNIMKNTLNEEYPFFFHLPIDFHKQLSRIGYKLIFFFSRYFQPEHGPAMAKSQIDTWIYYIMMLNVKLHNFILIILYYTYYIRLYCYCSYSQILQVLLIDNNILHSVNCFSQ